MCTPQLDRSEMFTELYREEYNIGKLNLGIEYQWTAVQYGEYQNNVYEPGAEPVVSLDKRGLASEGLHWVGNHRVNLMVKFNF